MKPTPEHPDRLQTATPNVNVVLAEDAAEDEALESISVGFLQAVLEQKRQRNQALYERKKIDNLKAIIISFVQSGDSSGSPEVQRRIIETALKETCDDLAAS